MEGFNLSGFVSDILRNNFKLVNDYGDFLHCFKVPFSIIYGGTESGKTYSMKRIFEAYKGTILYVKTSPVDWEKDGVINLDANMNTFKLIRLLLDERTEKIRNHEKMAWAFIVFDDIQNLSKDDNREFELLLDTLSYSGRHYKLRTIILAQHYVGIPKRSRAQAGTFLSLLPISDTYRHQIYLDYWKIFESDTNLTELEKLPEHSFILKYKSKRFYRIN